MLYENRKFDIRTFVLLVVKSGKPTLLFNRGFMRCCVENYRKLTSDEIIDEATLKANYTNITKQKLNPEFKNNSDKVYTDINKLSEVTDDSKVWPQIEKNISEVCH